MVIGQSGQNGQIALHPVGRAPSSEEEFALVNPGMGTHALVPQCNITSVQLWSVQQVTTTALTNNYIAD